MSLPSSHSLHSGTPSSTPGSLPKVGADQEKNVSLSPEELIEQRSQWMSTLLAENPQLLALRERSLPWTGGYSFANVVHTDTTAALTHINRHVILELIFQHLLAIGMHKTAETLKLESGHEYQYSDKPWDKTDLLLLTSLGVLPREDPWTITVDPHHQFVEESLEEDFFASPYRENPNEIYRELLDPDLNVVYSGKEKCFSQLKAASLRRMVVLLATSTSDTLPDEEIYKFFLTLHSITSSHHFLEHLIAIFDCHLLQTPDEESHQKILGMQKDLHKNVINLIKKWLAFHGLFIGRKTIKSISQFMRRITDDRVTYADVETFATAILNQIKTLTHGTKIGVLPTPDSKPNIPDAQIIFKPTLRITEPDPLEVARQITLLFHAAFKAVHSREFVVALGDQRVSHQTPTLAEFFDFGERLTILVMETVATSQERAVAITRLLEIATKLGDLGNYDALACVIRALRCDEMRELPDWDRMPSARDTLKILYEKSGDEIMTRANYDTSVDERFQSWSPAIPNLRTELKSVRPDNSPPFIKGSNLINWEKRRDISEKTSVLYRFQNQMYNYWPIPQIQSVVNRGPSLSLKQAREKLGQGMR